MEEGYPYSQKFENALKTTLYYTVGVD